MPELLNRVDRRLTAEEAFRAGLQDASAAQQRTRAALRQQLISKGEAPDYFRSIIAALYEVRVLNGELERQTSTTRRA